MSTFVAGLTQALVECTTAEAVLLSPQRFRAGPRQYRAQLLLAIQQFRQLARLRPNVIHVHENPALLTAAVAHRMLVRNDVRVLYTVHVDPVEPRQFWKRAALGWMLGCCWNVSTVSASTAARLAYIATPVPASISVIHGGTNITVRTADSPEVAQFRSTFGLRDGPVVCQISPLNFPRKVAGVVELVRAFRLVRARFPNAKLLLVGDGKLRGDVEAACVQNQVADAVVLPGYVEDVSVPLAVANVYCQITHQDACPLSLLEAMRSAKPVVAAQTGGIPEIISHGSNGLLVDISPDEIARAIIRLLEQPDEARALSLRATETIQACFTWEHAARQFAELYGLPVLGG